LFRVNSLRPRAAVRANPLHQVPTVRLLRDVRHVTAPPSSDATLTTRSAPAAPCNEPFATRRDRSHAPRFALKTPSTALPPRCSNIAHSRRPSFLLTPLVT